MEFKKVALKTSNTNEISNTNKPIVYKKRSAIQDTFKIDTMLVNALKRFEGIRYSIYTCSANQKTVGCGHAIKKIDAHLKYPITDNQVDSLLNNDILIAKNNVLKVLPNIQGNKLSAMISLYFNMGNIPNKVINAVNNNQSLDSLLLVYCRYKDPKTKQSKRLDGLYKRRQWELNLFNSM